MGWGSLGEEDLLAALTPTEVFGLKAGQIEISGAPDGKPQAIIGVVAISGRTTHWFIKLKGPQEAAMGQKKNFEAFVKSLKLE